MLIHRSRVMARSTGLNIQRYKGFDATDAHHLFDISMRPNTRKILKVNVE